MSQRLRENLALLGQIVMILWKPAIELVGFALLVTSAWRVDEELGLFAAAALLILVGNRD